MTDEKRGNGRRRLRALGTYAVAAGLLAIGVGSVVYLLLTRPRPLGQEPTRAGPLVRVFAAGRVDHRPAITSYGVSRAGRQWAAIAEVAGRAVEIHERFEQGSVLPAGAVLARIDPTDYELACKRYEANVAYTQQQLRELDQQETNLQELATLAERQLELAAGELERVRDLFRREMESQRALDNIESAWVTQKRAVQELRNSLALIPMQRDRLKASQAQTQADLEQAEANLAKTSIRLPFDARCATREVEPDQFVTTGGRLGVFFSVDKAEVVAMVNVRQFAVVMAGAPPMEIPENIADADELFERFALPAEIRWAGGEHLTATRRGRVARPESALDAQTRTIPVIVEVPDPFKGVIPGERPPLLPDMFCEVTILGYPLTDVFVIPRDSLHDDRVHVLREGRLHVATVDVAVLDEDRAVVREGLEDGDLVVMTDLYPIVEGMPLRGETVPNPVKPRPIGFSAAEEPAS